MSKWFTCAPVRFKGDASFFWRDSGLLCRGLQELGHESRVILPGPGFEGDESDILRADAAQLRSAAWWRDLKLDGLIMVAWGRHRDTPIVKAIAESGTRLVLHLDSIGDHFPLFNQLEGLKMYWRAERDTARNFADRFRRFLVSVTTDGTKNLLRHSYLKYRHLKYASIVTCQTPLSVEGNLRLCRFFGGPRHGVNVRLAGYPISKHCVWDPGVRKEKRVIAIGRWDDLRQKRPKVLMEVCSELTRRMTDVAVDIFGRTTPLMEKWHQELPESQRHRIFLHGSQPGPAVATAMQKAQVSFFPSSYEGGPQALFEALSCGCTTVGLDSIYLPGHKWAADRGHACLAGNDTSCGYLRAIERSLQSSAADTQHATIIAAHWHQWTRVHAVLERMLSLRH